MFRRPITSSTILRVLVVGFALVMTLLVAAGFVALRSARAIRQQAARLVEEQLITTRLIDQFQREQGVFSAVHANLEHAPDSVDADEVLRRLAESEARIDRIVTEAEGTPEEPLWRELKRETADFSREARRLLALRTPASASTQALARHHDETAALVARLIAASHDRATRAEDQIRSRSRELERNSAVLLGACFVLALVCAALSSRMVATLFREMQWQSEELSRVSWQMLENQEGTARRFSHELHDELGQSLTAIKANLVALGTARPEAAVRRLADCVHLVDEALANVRQLSQLLRPTILDDFGLDAGLRWLCDGFGQRTGVEVEYVSNFDGRLADETETHLFRIAQEALTNVARHSGASRVVVRLHNTSQQIELSVEDNGRGLASGGDRAVTLGMVGMRARARNAGGELTLHAANGGGLRVEARVPARTEHHVEENPSPVGR